MNYTEDQQRNLGMLDESIGDVDQNTAGYLKRHLFQVFAFFGITIVIEIVLFFSGLTNYEIYILPLIIPIIGYRIISGRVQHEFMQQFSIHKGFTYLPKGNLDGLDGNLFQIGYNRLVTDVIKGEYKNCPMTLLTYSYVSQNNRYSQTYTYTVFELQFKTKMPNILLQKISDSYEESFEKCFDGDILKLEGDFNKYFTVNVAKGYELEALEVFTPDVMADLIDKAKNFSLEIVNDHLFIYAHKIISTKKELIEFYDLAQYFVEKLGPVLSKIKVSA